LAKKKRPVFGMIQRSGESVIRMLADVKQATIGPLIRRTIRPGATVSSAAYAISARLPQWGAAPLTVCHAEGEYARDDDGDGFCAVESTPWKASGHCIGRGSGRIGGSHRRGCRCPWGTSSSCTMSGGGARRCWIR
jgi:hypothetical protein